MPEIAKRYIYIYNIYKLDIYINNNNIEISEGISVSKTLDSRT